MSFPLISCPEKNPRSLAVSMYFARSEDSSTSVKVTFLFAVFPPNIPTIIFAASARDMVSFGRKFVLLLVMIPLETARETYGAYHTLGATSLNIEVVPVPIFHPAALKAILRNSARVRLLSGLYFSVLFITPRLTSLSIYPFAQLLVISVNFISDKDFRARPGLLKVVVVVPLAVVVVIVTLFSFFITSTVTPLPTEIVPVDVVLSEHFPS